MRIKKYCLLGLLLIVFSSAGIAQKKQELSILVTSPASPINRLPELLSVSWKDILKKYPTIKADSFKVLQEDNTELPFQLEYKGLAAIQNLLIAVDVPAGKTMKLRIVAGKPAVVSPKVFGRYVPERKDDFAWENDKIAFRMYGKALEGTNENAYGIDVWAKRTDKMILNEWYKSGDYHADRGDGLDYYSVGFTLGAGDIAPIVDDKIVFPNNYRNWKIIDNGPLRFTFQLDYEAWDVSGTQVKVSKQFSLDAGSQLNRVAATFSFKKDDGALPVVVGIVKRKEQGAIVSPMDNKGVVGYWEPAHGKDGILGIGTIMLDPQSKTMDTDSHVQQLAVAKDGKTVVYYTGAAWNKAGTITSAEEWFSYLNRFQSSLKAPLTVKIN